MKKVIGVGLALIFLGIAAVAGMLIHFSANLPRLVTVQDFRPLLISEVYDRNGLKIGEFQRENRKLVNYEDIPPLLVNAFLAAEDSAFFEHSGINFQAIFRSMIKNIKEGRWAQGGSTITQQVARALMLTSKKTLTRKIREILLAFRMEAHLSKQEILYLYFNQIYFGQGAYGIVAASETYFRKPLNQLKLEEMAILAGLPQAPSRYTPIYRPKLAKKRQRYVLSRMAKVGYVSDEEAKLAMEKPIEVFVRENYKALAPFYVETIRQMLVAEIGEKKVLDEGIRIYTGLDLELQKKAQESVRKGLRALDKRQGYRGAEKNFTDASKITEFLTKTRNKMISQRSPMRTIMPDGSIHRPGALNLDTDVTIPDYIDKMDIVDAVVINVDDTWGLTTVRFAESRGLIDMESMEWARKPDPVKHHSWDKIKHPSLALKMGDIIQVKVISGKFRSSRLAKKLRELRRRRGKNYSRPADLPDFDKFARVELEQEPITEGALISFDLRTGEIISMIGGYDFDRSKYNRTIQSRRQTGSAFKAIVYAAAMDKNYTPATQIPDVPLVYENEKIIETETADGLEREAVVTRWKPRNHSKKFGGEILFRNALIRSLNVPTVRILADIGVDWVADYSRRLGIFSPLNMDMTLGLGSSGVTLYEMTKVFSHFARNGKRITPLLIRRVEDRNGNPIIENLSLDKRFESQIKEYDRQYEKRRHAYLNWSRKNDHKQAPTPLQPDTVISETDEIQDDAVAKKKSKRKKRMENEPPFFFRNPDQLIKPSTAYLITSLLKGTVHERGGTGGRARVLGRPLGGKTGTTSDYFDAWFMGFSPHISAGVWVGYDRERSLGRGEVGTVAALPIWIDFMREATAGKPKNDFQAPGGIVFVNIDNDTGQLASSSSQHIVRQAFEEGTAPSATSEEVEEDAGSRFLKEDLSE